jgi:hypothetical protein
MFKFDKDELKFSLTIDQILDYTNELGGEGIQVNDNILTFKTICHGGDSHKLYYYDNTHLYKCYTQCEETSGFDIYQLTQKVKSRETETQWSLPKAISYVAQYFGIIANENNFDDSQEQLKDWEILNNYNKVNNFEKRSQIVELKTYDDNILKNLPHPRIIPWEQEGIKKEVIEDCGIAYDPINEGIIIPHYDINNNLIGIRERTLIEENEKYGKYMPAKLNGILYRHPLSFNLYNLNNSKENIKLMKKAVVFEGEKSPLLYRSYFGKENDISVACCGSSLISYQVKLLLSLGVKEIAIAYDKQFKEIGDKEWEHWTKKLKDIHKKYGVYVQISFIFDKNNLLEYKMSPIDTSPDIFLQLFKERIFL